MNLRDLFLNRICSESLCGTQVCDGSEEFLEGCKKYQQFIEKVDKIKDLEISEFEIAFEAIVADLLD